MIIIRQEDLVFLNMETEKSPLDDVNKWRPDHYKIYIGIERDFREKLEGNLYENLIIETRNGFEKYESLKVIDNYWQDKRRKKVRCMSLRAYFLELIGNEEDLVKEII